ncbi:flagellar cap protein FliD N-terminal domain-containing protein [Virgibacillus halophilus]|uniref:Filament cap protein n=1 Tax=Tigheibacillus halophilus TaxID=361280 RepID=A0ABU5C3D0_9BACI|nr:flagellar cap protein FliD N-terminal domain-containing protein [Virgibacillus halophilus]
MRIGGLATGMDIDELVNKLMTAERVPLNKMQQNQTTLTWQRDAFRDVNKTLKELDDMMLDMKLSKAYNTKKS